MRRAGILIRSPYAGRVNGKSKSQGIEGIVPHPLKIAEDGAAGFMLKEKKNGASPPSLTSLRGHWSSRCEKGWM